MDFKDKPEFAAVLEVAARRVNKTLDQEEIEFFFGELKGYKIEHVKEAIATAMNDRDPDDAFLYRSMLTVQEIRAAAERLLVDSVVKGKVGCERCEQKGWLTSIDKSGKMTAWPCSCLYEVAKEKLKIRKHRGSMELHLDHYREQIVRSYEAHKKGWGQEIPAEEKKEGSRQQKLIKEIEEVHEKMNQTIDREMREEEDEIPF